MHRNGYWVQTKLKLITSRYEKNSACKVRVAEEPDVGNLQVRFREGHRNIPHGRIVWHPPYRKRRETENTKNA